MKYELDDPKITAYALGELDETEKEAMEAFLNENEAARDEVARIREAAQWLTAELGAEAPEGLSELEQARIMDQAKKPKQGFRTRWGALAAAMVVVALGSMFFLMLLSGAINTAGGGYSMMSAEERAASITAASIVNEGGSVSANAPVAPVEAKELRYQQNQVAPPERLAEMAPVTPGAAQAPAAPPAKQNVGWDQIGTKTMSQQAVIGDADTSQVSTSAPAASPAKPADGWNTIGTKTMSQQAVDGKADQYGVYGSNMAPEAVSAPGAGGDLQSVTVGGNLRIRGSEVTATEKAKEKKDSVPVLGDMNGNAASAPAPPTTISEVTIDAYWANGSSTANAPDASSAPATPPAEVKDQLQALGYGGVSANAPAPASNEKKQELSKGGIVAEQDARIMPRPMPVPPPPPTPVPNSESYPVLPENTFQRTVDAPLSTFGLDVDTASYANMRRFLSQGTLPPGEAVRIEEMINYFKYDYPKPEGDAPFSVTVDAHPCPWAPTHTLARIGVRGKDLNTETRPAANLVFLIDVSGSMQDADKLPLLKKGMKLLTQTVTANDRVSIVTYASGTGVALYPTSGDNKTTIENIIDNLSAGGSTNGAGGIQLAYDLARRAFIQGGVNRVILATDGDFNVGVSDTGTLVGMIEQQAKTGVALSVLGFGQGNIKDDRLMSLADKGNGNYAYIDSFQEARKALLEQATGTLFTIAKDVKIQVEFNPGKVGAYRLIGYEKRMLAAQDFNDDRKDAGEIGAGHTVTALYELVAPGEAISPPQTDPLKYQTNAAPETATPPATDSPELMTVKLRFKPPTGDVSTRFDVPIPATIVTAETRPDFQFASAVAAFGMLLRHSSYAGTSTMDMVINLAQQGKGADENGLRAEFVNLARTASALMGTPQPQPMLQ